MNVAVTGGYGFIGCNVARRHLERGDHVCVIDNCSRKGSELNKQWLLSGPLAKRLISVEGDVRDPGVLRKGILSATDIVYHFAAQTAVTTSVTDPVNDFQVNAMGTLNMLETVRHVAPEAVVFYPSTNKVYGDLSDVRVAEEPQRYTLPDLPAGISERQPLDFHSPYGCSKGCADQYVRDYARIYSLRTVVFRLSCIYGIRQFGMEDQGWVAYFCIRATQGKGLTIYGNGKQVRDILWIDDLIDAFILAHKHITATAGQVFNLGGGVANAVSVGFDVMGQIRSLSGHSTAVAFADWRPGDQRIYITDSGKAWQTLGWKPKISYGDGIERLWKWISENRQYFPIHK